MSRVSRRKFLGAVGLAGTGSALAALAVGSVPQSQPVQKAAAGERKAAGYQASAHVRSYYRTARV